MKTKTLVFTLVAVIATALVLFWLGHPRLDAETVLTKTYGKYDQKHQCWIRVDQNQRFCMKLDRFDKVFAGSGFRLYVFAIGNAIDDSGKPIAGEKPPGAVGAFIVEEHDGQFRFIASDPLFRVSTDTVPNRWQLLKLGGKGYWGWKNVLTVCDQGICVGRYSIIAPRGEKMRELAGFTARYEDIARCGGDAACESKSTEIVSMLRMNADTGDEHFPLSVIVRGKDKGRALLENTWAVPFDTNHWKYIPPPDWPIKLNG
jgi:hypothetical protein